MKRSKVLIRSRGLALDVSRCMGQGCKDKNHCERHTQLKKDKADDRVPVTTGLIDDSGRCRMRIGLD